MIRRAGVAAAAVSLVLLGSACQVDGDGAQRANDEEVGQEAAAQVASQREQEQSRQALPTRPAGVLRVDGSTRGSLTAETVERYRGTGAAVDVQVAHGGEEQGFAALCSGDLDVVDSARPISDAELAACASRGLEVVQFQVAAEAVVVAIKSESDVGGDCLSVQQVEELYRAGSQVDSWDDLGFADVPLTVGGPDADNNAFGFFGKTVLGAPEAAMAYLRSDYQAFENDQGAREFVVGTPEQVETARELPQRASIAESARGDVKRLRAALSEAELRLTEARAERQKGISDRRSAADQSADQARLQKAERDVDKARSELRAARGSLSTIARSEAEARAASSALNATQGRVAYFRFSYYELFEEELRPFEISADRTGEKCVFPSQWTVTSGDYPLARQLLLTTTTRGLERRELRDFLGYYLETSQEAAEDARMVPLPDSLVASQQEWLGGSAKPKVVTPQAAEAAASEAPVEPAR